MADRCPTEKQYARMLMLASGAMLVSGADRGLRALVSRGWLAPEWPDKPDNGLRITPDGLRALARAVERYGLPELGPQRQRQEPILVQRLRQDRDDARADAVLARREALRLRAAARRAAGELARAVEVSDA